MSRVLVVVTCLLAVGALGEKSCDAKLEAAEKKVKKLQGELDALKGKQGSGSCPLSVMDTLSTASNIVSDMATHVLSQTDIDEQVMGHYTTAQGLASSTYTDAMKQVPSYDFSMKQVTDAVNTALAHEAVAPHYKTVRTALDPHMNQHVYPAMTAANDQFQKTYATLHKEVSPFMNVRQRVTAAYATADDAVNAAVLTPVFELLAKMTPRHSHSLPKHTADRCLFLVAAVFGLYVALTCLSVVLRVGFKAAGLTLWLTVKVPIKATLMCLGVWFYFVTIFYCCGACRSKKAADSKNGGDAKKNGAGSASEKELTKLLGDAQKQKKVQEAAKTLANLVKNGKSMSSPADMKGKTIQKDALMKAVAKYKDIDVKKLGL